MKKIYSEDTQRLLEAIISDCEKEDQSVRERQLRTWRRLKLFWEGYTQVWYSETAHDWRIWDEQSNQNNDQAAYDKPINVFRAYLESIIAALSITIPPVKCYPDDADAPLDLSTANAGDKISGLIYRHNDVSMLWLHALFIYCTEGMVGAYNYIKSDKSYGTYEEKSYENATENHEVTSCSNCGHVINDRVMEASEPFQEGYQIKQGAAQPNQAAPDSKQPDSEEMANQERSEFDPGQDDVEVNGALNSGQDLCPACMMQMDPDIKQGSFVVTRLVGCMTLPKSRVCLEAYGGMNIKVPNYAKKQSDCPYLIFSKEYHYSLMIEKYGDLGKNEKFLNTLKSGGTAGSYEQYDQWARLSPQYRGEYPINVVTEKLSWLRPASFNILQDEDDVKHLKKLFPSGVCVAQVNNTFADAYPQDLDDHWTLTYNPMADYIHFDPLGLLLASIQEITGDLVSLTLQTIEHGVGLTFADPGVLNFKAYEQTEVTPGAVLPATPKSGKSISDGFFETKTATLSPEILPFFQNIQSLGQIVSGALPSLFGGQLQGSETASQYSMSRAQALQRLQNTWKMLTVWWKQIFGKAIPMYIKEVKEDERDVQYNKDNGFMNVFIRMADLQGKIGKVELEANENLPLTWSQQKDVIMQLLQAASPEVMEILNAPENREVIQEAIGLTNMTVPGEDDREKQLEEIKLLITSEPITVPVPPELMQQAQMAGVEPPQPQEIPSVEPEPDIDDDAIHFSICRNWLVSEAGRQCKTDNEPGYKNVLLHAKMHLEAIQMKLMQQQQMQMAQGQSGAANPKKPNVTKTQEAPITGEANVKPA